MGRSAAILAACSDESSPLQSSGCEEHLINAQVEYLRSDLTDISRMRPSEGADLAFFLELQLWRLAWETPQQSVFVRG